MSKKHPRKWFVNAYFARITLRPVRSTDEFFKSISPFFDTWDEAREHLLKYAEIRLKNAKAELPAAERNLKRVQALRAQEGPKP